MKCRVSIARILRVDVELLPRSMDDVEQVINVEAAFVAYRHVKCGITLEIRQCRVDVRQAPHRFDWILLSGRQVEESVAFMIAFVEQ